ncbi:hypothetical protein B2J93_4685 [Marssonina coronariae]|uniref:Peptidase A1 domain-containing protein n=1 Tax=Diplocarpon coronariae TaxID=2795749 RepID=A0A218Z3L3_9HELO|nr:hypothetical protein B2J93_4685 [Marssonina coronariae]
MLILHLLTSLLPLVSATAIDREVQRTHHKPLALRAPSPDVNVTTYFELSRGKYRQSRSTPLLPAHRRGKTGIAPTREIQKGQAWSAALKIGKKTYNLLIDTGSSDTWLATTDFVCYNADSVAVSQAECEFAPAPLYKPGKELTPIKGVNFNIQYGDGAFVRGSYGMANVELGGIHVNQQIALAKEVGWLGDGISTGVLGLAYPSITFAFSGTKYSTDVPETQLPYNPIFTSMYTQQKIPPVFSLAIQRAAVPPDNRPEGYLALGGLAPVATYGKWAKAPIEYVEIGPGYLNGSLNWPQYQWYTLTPDGFFFSAATSSPTAAPDWQPLNTSGGPSKPQVIIDSLATLIWLPSATANHVASLFSPPAIWDADVYGYAVPCDALAPTIAVKIRGVVLPLDGRDLIIDDMSGRGTCISGVSDGGTYEPYVLGDTWLKSVLVVFDVGGGEIRVRSRGIY